MPGDKCPVDHKHNPTDKCPVDHATRSTLSDLIPKHNSAHSTSHGYNAPLSTARETSSIPKTHEGNWVYPSEAQFFAAMARKNHNPQTADMKTIVPIHNAVNERAWGEVMKWEAGRGGEKCGGVKLVNFKGKPGQISLKARWKSLLGYVIVHSSNIFLLGLD
jgi:cytochrome c heme-lyase